MHLESKVSLSDWFYEKNSSKNKSRKRLVYMSPKSAGNHISDSEHDKLILEVAQNPSHLIFASILCKIRPHHFEWW